MPRKGRHTDRERAGVLAHGTMDTERNKMEEKFIVRVTEKKTREVVVSAKNAEEAKRRGVEALGIAPAK
jgi:hypothetical protein